jgi:hypothetical protein
VQCKPHFFLPSMAGVMNIIKTLAGETLNYTEARLARSVVLAPRYLRTVIFILLVALLSHNAPMSGGCFRGLGDRCALSCVEAACFRSSGLTGSIEPPGWQSTQNRSRVRNFREAEFRSAHHIRSARLWNGDLI